MIATALRLSREGMQVALCTVCGVSNAGLGGVPLIQVDEEFYCQRCLVKTKGTIRCCVCGMTAGSTNDALTSLPDGKYICSSCADKQRRFAAAKEAAAAAPLVIDLPIEPLSGGLKRAYDETVPPDEKVLFVLAASCGEAIVATDKRAVVLKAGFASGSPGRHKGRAFPYETIEGVEVRTGLVQGWIRIAAPGVRPASAAAGDAYLSDNCVTFLSEARGKFEQAAKALQELVERARW